MTFEEMLDEILKSEGGYNPADGKAADGTPIPSYAGVLQTTYNWWLRVRANSVDFCGGPPPPDVRALELRPDVVTEFYRWWIWERSGAADVPAWFAYMLADWYVQSGGHAIKPLQKRAGCDVDGAWGPGTKAAVGAMLEGVEKETESNPHADNDLVRWYDQVRRDFMKRVLPENLLPGVLARCDKVLRITLEKVEANDALAVPKTLDVAEEADFKDVSWQSHRSEELICDEPDEVPPEEPLVSDRLASIEQKLDQVLEKLNVL